MQDSVLNLESGSMDLTKVAALQQKRTLAFVNHFTITTVQFINNFARQCELKLMNFKRKLEKVNATMVLLEARLSSIPEINNSVENTKTSEIVNDTNDNNNNELEIETSDKDNDTNNEQSSLDEEINPEYQRFVKMYQVGVPLDAVKLKLSLEGLDPKILEKLLRI